MTDAALSIGDHLRDWRKRRRMSQLDLALAADVSQRHLSFIESGRARPSREMLLNLAERLGIPLRRRNPLLTAAGFAPLYGAGALDRPETEAALRAVETILAAHEPAPALAVDRHWNLVRSNRALLALVGDVTDPALLSPPINVLKLSLSPRGLAPRIVNFAEWRHHLLERLRREVEASGDSDLDALHQELKRLPAPGPSVMQDRPRQAPLFVPLRIMVGDRELSLISMTSVFGTATDIELSELTLETFLPANPNSAEILRTLLDA